jgi:hypothetical protein
MRALIALAVVSLVAASVSTVQVFADPAPGSIMKADPPPDAVKLCLINYQKRVAMLGALGTKLKLSVQQQPLFDAWRKTMLEITHASPCPAPPTGMNVATPERIANQIKMLEVTWRACARNSPRPTRSMPR